MIRNHAALVSVALAALVAGRSTPASAQIYSRSNAPVSLEGDRFETMRSLAHFLDEGVQFTLEEATDALADSRSGGDRMFLESLRRLAARTDSFHERLDNYQANPWDIQGDVRVLVSEARRVNGRLRRVNAVRNLYDDWSDVVDDLNRMQQLLAGRDVQVPTAHPEWDTANNADNADGHHHDHADVRPGDYGSDRRPGGVYGNDRGAFLTGRDLDTVRQLSHDLDMQARRALATAEADGEAYGRGTQMLADLRHFVSQTAALHNRTDADRIDPSEFGGVVNHLIEDARAADAGMRQARLFSDAWAEWRQTLDILDQLAATVRR
jgi:hypothetical protein